MKLLAKVNTIAFVLNGTLETINADGTNRRSLATNIHMVSPYSPDGRYLAFTRVQADDTTQVFIMNADGSNQRAIVTFSGSDVAQVKGGVSSIVWSPDSSAIAFSIARQTHPQYGFYAQIHMVTLDGSYLHILETSYGSVSAWLKKPDRIAYTVYNGTCGALYIQAIDFGEAHFLAGCQPVGKLDTYTIANQPCDFRNTISGSITWSPSGQQFALYLDHDNSCPLDIWVFNADGTHPYQLISSGFYPAWSNKTDQIAFVDGDNKQTHLCIVGLNQKLMDKGKQEHMM